jgi:response regulator RpfG family c-di-GMP phosphodiesterase/putative methionine-R-sulfoxide reductase with GAF domain
MDVMSVQGLSQQIVEAVLEEFGQSNCSLLLRNEQEGQIDRIAVAGPYKNKVAKGTLELDGVGMVPTVMRTGKLWNVGDVRLEDNYVPNWPEARSELAIPLKIGERIIGAIDIQSTHRNAFGPNDERILGLFAERAALALENASYQEQTRQRAEQLATVGRIGRELGQLLDLPSIYPEFARALIDLLDQTSAITISHYITQESGLRTVFGYEHDHEMSEARLTSLAEFSQRTGYPITAILTQRPHVISQIQILELDDESGSVPENFTYKSMIVSPLMARGEPIGVLEVYSEKAGNYIEDDIELLSLVANTAAIAISNAQLFQDARDHINRLQTLRRIDSVLNTSLENRESLNAITNEIIQHLGVDAIALSLYNEVDGFFRAETQQGFLPSIRIPPFALRHGAISQNIRTQSALLLRNTHEIPNDFERKTFSLVCGYELYAMVPIFAKGELKGILEVFQEQPMYPSSYWMSFLETIAGQLAIALQNINLFQNLQHINDELLHAYDATIEGWAHALDLRDEETKGHSQRVTGMTVRVAHALGMDSKQLVHLRRGALLHDIGKMGIPDSILHKPGPLTDEEWVMMKMHPEFAFQLLRDIPYLQPAIDIPYAHHEHWDGSGYPRGLKGEDIPLAARIFTIVDVWDALLSDRPYRNAWPSDQVRAYLEEKSGSQFDPEVVSTFLEVWSPRIVEKKPEILIVEKNADGELAKLQAYLEPTYKVYVTESEKTALDYLGSRNISLILIREDDLWASGVSLMRTAQDINPAILGILFANQLLPETLTKSINLPIVIGYMTLPIKVEDLQSKIEYALSEYKLNREIVHVSTKERTQMRAEASSNAAVLIVDDEPHVIRMLQHTLKKHFAVIAAKSGQEALTLMKKHEIAIVISDQSMPEMSGEVLLEQVAQLYPAVGTMLMSAAAQGEDLQVAFNTGNISGFFQKPLDPEQILVKVWHAYDRYQMRKRFANKEQDNE